MMKREWKIALIAMGGVTFLLLLAAIGIFLSSTIRALTGQKEVVNIYVQSPPLADLGEDVRMTIMMENLGEGLVSIDEIRLPAPLTDAAVIKEVFPSLEPGRQEFYGDKTGYFIGLMLEPGERREFYIDLMPWQIADVASEIEIVRGKEMTSVGFRILFNKPVAIQPTSTEVFTPTPTITPLPTATEVPTPAAVVLPYQSVVKIIAKIKYSSYLRDLWGGSGTIVSEDGLILTNAHLVLPAQGVEPDAFVIALSHDPAEPPVEMYYAESVLIDEDLDLAVVRITSDLQFKRIDWVTTRLPTAPLGNSDTLNLGDPITILGYPGIGGETITLTTGNVGGFTAQKTYGDRAYIKTAASISGGTSGGMALNTLGQMIAVPTQLGSGDEEVIVDCRVITDTNGDGKVNQRDACVPVGGFINAMRPINLAVALINSAKQIANSTR